MVLLHTVAAVTAGLLTSGLAAVGVGALQQTDTPGPAPAPSTTAREVKCHAALARLPDRLRTDLESARNQPTGERGKAVRSVRETALHGDYGTTAQRWAERRIYRHARIAARMPKELRSDLRAVHRLPTDDRQTARRSIRQKVLDGAYGNAAQQAAKKRAKHRAGCRAQQS